MKKIQVWVIFLHHLHTLIKKYQKLFRKYINSSKSFLKTINLNNITSTFLLLLLI